VFGLYELFFWMNFGPSSALIPVSKSPNCFLNAQARNSSQITLEIHIGQSPLRLLSYSSALVAIDCLLECVVCGAWIPRRRPT
jgi:hypothetical protein